MMKDYKQLFLYGLVLAILVFFLKLLQWRFLIVENAVDLYAGVLAVFFTALGIWIATRLVRPKIQTVVVERQIREQFFRNEAELERLRLNRREFEILELLSKGYSNAEIADHLFLSLSTVKTHVSNLFTKMEVKSRTQAIEKAKRLKIIQ